MNTGNEAKSLSALRLLCLCVLWHPLWKERVRQYVSCAEESDLIRTTIRASWCGAGYGLTIAGMYGSILLYMRNVVSAFAAVVGMIVLLCVFLASAKGMGRVRTAICAETNMRMTNWETKRDASQKMHE